MRIYHLPAILLTQLITLSSSIPLATTPSSNLLIRETSNINCDNVHHTITGVQINPRSLDPSDPNAAANKNPNNNNPLTPRTPVIPGIPNIPPNPLWDPSTNPLGHRTIIWCAWPNGITETWMALTMTSILPALPNPSNLPVSSPMASAAIAALLEQAAVYVNEQHYYNGDYILPNGFYWHLPSTVPGSGHGGYLLNIWNTRLQIPFGLVELIVRLLYDYMHDYGWGTCEFVVFEGVLEAGRGVIYQNW